MYPLLVPERDYAIVSPAERRIRRLDVVVYRSSKNNGRLVIHRVCRAGRAGLYLVGDNEAVTEGPVDRDCVFGVMEAFIRNGKKHNTSNIIYRFLSGVWMLLRPLRPVLSKTAHAFRVIFNKRKT